MNKVKGFFMTEFLVYLVLFSCIVIYLMQLLVSSSLQLRTQEIELQRTLQVLTALDLIAYELSQADASKVTWYKTEKDSVIWHSKAKNKDIGFCCIKNRLLRIVGNYDANNGRWTSKISNSIAENIKSVAFNYQWNAVGDNDQMALVNCTLEGNLQATRSYSASRSIALPNRCL